MAYCISICLDKKSENLTHSFKYDLSKVVECHEKWKILQTHEANFSFQLLQRILVSTRSINNHLVSTVVPYLTSRRQYKKFLSYQELDYEDGGNSRCVYFDRKLHAIFNCLWIFQLRRRWWLSVPESKSESSQPQTIPTSQQHKPQSFGHELCDSATKCPLAILVR